MPSSADITAAKSEKILNGVMDVMKSQDLSKMITAIEDRLNEEDCTALELAAAFLKQQMGEDLPDIPAENYFEERKKKHKEHKDGYHSHKNYGGHNSDFQSDRKKSGKRKPEYSEKDRKKKDRPDHKQKNGKQDRKPKKERIDVRMDGSRKIKTLPSKKYKKMFQP